MKYAKLKNVRHFTLNSSSWSPNFVIALLFPLVTQAAADMQQLFAAEGSFDYPRPLSPPRLFALSAAGFLGPSVP